MSAIFGIIDFEGRPVEESWIKSMQDDLAHRGPDGKSIYREGSMFLGHMLLQVTPESIYDSSPYEEDGFLITANARLDEREAIMERLNIPQEERESITDPLLLMRSFIKYGKDFVKDIYGDFAFAIWDKENKELFCARDQIGVKPLLYYFEDNRLVFSTELKSIVKLEFVSTQVNDTNIRNDYFDVKDKLDVTIWKNVKRLPAANHLMISRKNSETNQYWALHYQKNNLFKSIDSSARALEEIMVKAIEDRMRTISPVGVPLSGGLDSSSIACVAARHSEKIKKNIFSFSSMLDPKLSNEENKDETEYIRAVLSQETNIIPGFFYHSQLNFFRNLEKSFARYYAICSPFNYVDEAIYENFEKVKVRRLLSGFVGDITVSNRTILPLAHIFLSGRFGTMLRLGLLIKRRMGISFFELIKTQLYGPLIPLYLKKIWHLLKRGKLSSEIDLPIILNKDEKLKFLKKRKEFQTNQSTYNFKIEEHILPPGFEVFREDFDTGSSYYQMEYTHPLMDRRVLECLMKMPVEYFYANGFQRGLIREAMKKYLPEKIRKRTDKGFYSPGFFHVIFKDIPGIIKHIESGVKLHPEIYDFFNVDKVLKHLKGMIDKKKLSFFSIKDWNYIYLSTWIIYKLWIFNNKYGNKKKHQAKLE